MTGRPCRGLIPANIVRAFLKSRARSSFFSVRSSAPRTLLNLSDSPPRVFSAFAAGRQRRHKELAGNRERGAFDPPNASGS